MQSQKDVCEKELEAALPILEAAKAALDKINPQEINTLKKMGKPPILVRKVMDTVLLLRGKKLSKVMH